MHTILTEFLASKGTIGAICATVIITCTTLLVFKEPIKAFFSLIISRCNAKKITWGVEDLMASIDTLTAMMNNKIADDVDMVHTFSEDLKGIQNEINNMTVQVSTLIEKTRNREISYVLHDDHVDKILVKLDKFNDTLVQISTKIEYMSKSSVGF